MGSFYFTCCISNLPIESDTPVRYLALTENRYQRGNSSTCYVHDRWQLRTVPLRARYNDYGSIEDIKTGLARTVFFASFDQDLLPVGVGDNSVHDVAVKKGMSEAQWLDALWEGRVFVDGGYGRPRFRSEKERPPAYIPDFLRIETLLTEKGFVVSNNDRNKEGLLVDDRKDGFVRVRCTMASKNVQRTLASLVPVLDAAGFAAMVTCGTGNYAGAAELLIGPKPGQHRRVKGFAPVEEVKTRLAVAQSMVREDVWQILLTQTLPYFRGPLSIEQFRLDARLMVDQDLNLLAKNKDYDEEMRAALIFAGRSISHTDKNVMRSALSPGQGVSGFSLQQAMDLALQLHTSRPELDAFVEELAEACFINTAFSFLHGQWVPSRTGGQDDQWKLHRKVFKRFSKIRGNHEPPPKPKMP